MASNVNWPNGRAGWQQEPLPRLDVRLPTVTQALRYTPFSSIVPFDPDLVEAPLFVVSNKPTVFENVPNVTSTHKELERLVLGAKSAEDASKRCQQTLRDVQKLLRCDGITPFTFKRLSLPTKSESRPIRPVKPMLGAFAEMVLQNTTISYRYENQLSSQNHAQRAENENPTYHARLKPLQVAIPVRAAHSPVHEFRGARETQAEVAPKKGAFVLPATISAAQRAEYNKVPEQKIDSPEPSVHTVRNERLNSHVAAAPSAINVDQRRKADAAVETLSSLLDAIFVAEDQVQPDTSELTSSAATALVTHRVTSNGTVMVLRGDIQSKLDGAFHRVIAYGRLNSLEAEHLMRVQKLCGNAVAVLTSYQLSISEDWTEADHQEWAVRVANVAESLVAARTLVRILSASTRQKELQSEEHLREVLEGIRGTIETCVIPIVEMRSLVGDKIKGVKDSTLNPKFAIASQNKKLLQTLVRTMTKCLVSLGDLFMKSEIDESGISSLEYLCTTLIFAENASHERDAAIGIQCFEDLRRTAMDLLAKTFSRYTNQRQFILDEILMSLEKLPSSKQNARQFRLNDGRPIQLVSALLMRLVQTSATSSSMVTGGAADSAASKNHGSIEPESLNSEQENSSESSETDDEAISVKRSKKATHAATSHPAPGTNGLSVVVQPLSEAVRKNVNYIVKMLLQRALATSKSSEEPFRKLLDIFVEDFLNVLSSSDWPSAEILLRTLVISLIGIAENSKSPAPARTLALEVLGIVGSGVIDVRTSTQDAARAIDLDNETSHKLAIIAQELDTAATVSNSVVVDKGPYHVVIQYLYAREVSDAQLQTARGYHLLQWADLILGSAESITADRSAKDLHLERNLVGMLEDPQWLENCAGSQAPTTAQGRLAAKIIASNSLLCKAFARIFGVFLASMSSEQPTIRSRSIKSVTMLLEKDPLILDRNVQILNQIFRSLRDTSSLVRDSALTLVEKCVSLKPTLDVQIYEQVIPRTTDTAVSVRKRALRLLERIYVHNSDPELRSVIANAIITRVKDSDPGVSEAARSTVEEIWFSAFKIPSSADERSLDETMRYRLQAALMIRTVENSEGAAQILMSLIRSLLTSSKQAIDNRSVCKTMVAVLFEGIIDNAEIPNFPSQSSTLQTLTVFAKAQPQLFTASQLELLEPYVQNLTNSDDLDVYHYAIIILRHTMPCLSGINTEFLQRLQTSLLTSVGKIPQTELAVVAPCLWSIDQVLRNTDRLVRFMISALNGLYNLREDDLRANPAKATKIMKLLSIVGHFGNACNFDDHAKPFKQAFPSFNSQSVSALWIETICNFTTPSQLLTVREAALNAVCAICQGYPQQFLRADVTNAFEMALSDRESTLENVLLSSLEVFFCAQEATTVESDDLDVGTGVASGTQRLGGTYVATDQDSASASLSQRFLPDFLRLALSSMDHTALTAARIIVSINRQGMAHPRESGPCLVALETCPIAAIASMAFLEHKAQYAKHESVFEKELMRAVQQSFEYQRNVVNDMNGFTGNPPVSKFHFFWDVLKTGKAKIRIKFFATLCTKLDFDLSKMRTDTEQNTHLFLVRFCSEALAFLEYDKTDELLELLKQLEKTFAGTGTLVAQAIESEINNLQVAAESTGAPAADLVFHSEQPCIKPERLLALAMAAQVLTVLWETRSFLRRYWNLHRHVAKGKPTSRDNSRAPTRAVNASSLADAYISRVENVTSGSSSQSLQREMCLSFAELMSVDSDVRVGSGDEGDAELEQGHESPSDDDSATGTLTSLPEGSIRGKKRKSSISADDLRKRVRPL